MNDSIFRLKDEDSATADLQGLGIELGELLLGAAEGIVQMLHTLEHTADPVQAKRKALMWGQEAHEYICAAIEARETLAKEQRAAGLLSVLYTDVGVS